MGEMLINKEFKTGKHIFKKQNKTLLIGLQNTTRPPMERRLEP